MTSSILLAAALAADPSTPPPPPIFLAEAVRETVYVERVITERVVSPGAALTTSPQRDRMPQILTGVLMVGVGTYLTIHGSNNPRYEVEVSSDGRSIDVDKQTNPQVYLGVGLGLLGLVVSTL